MAIKHSPKSEHRSKHLPPKSTISGMKNSPVLATALNVFTLFVGIGIGVLIRPSLSTPVHAQQVSSSEPKIEEIQPIMTVGSAGIGIVLAGQVEADHLVVNGLDILKLNQGIVNYLATRPLAERADLQKIVNDSKPDVFYRVKSAAPPTKPSSETPERKEPK